MAVPPTVSALGSLGTARAARLGRPRPHGDPRSLWEIYISVTSSALTFGTRVFHLPRIHSYGRRLSR